MKAFLFCLLALVAFATVDAATLPSPDVGDEVTTVYVGTDMEAASVYYAQVYAQATDPTVPDTGTGLDTGPDTDTGTGVDAGPDTDTDTSFWMEFRSWLLSNWAEALLGLLLIIEVIVGLTPTDRDNAWFRWLKNLVYGILPNRAKSGGTHPL